MLRQLSRVVIGVTLLAVSTPASAQPAGAKKADPTKWNTDRICTEIDVVAKKYNLPRATFTRLIWTESRFDIRARSPKGAQGIAQFMPATAKDRGLADPYEPKSALHASGSLLADLRTQHGNFGLAAAAYNAGSSRVDRWLAGRSSLPFETQNYVAAITGQIAATFRDRSAKVQDKAIKKNLSFDEACRKLPVMRLRFKGVVPSAPRTPWGVQVAGNFSQAKAMRMWTRARAKMGVRLGNTKPSLHRERTRPGMKPKWLVRLGAKTKNEAIGLCKKIRRAGSYCLVRRNR